jgi:tetratricopeptide (TPR) repeat protein
VNSWSNPFASAHALAALGACALLAACQSAPPKSAPIAAPEAERPAPAAVSIRLPAAENAPATGPAAGQGPAVVLGAPTGPIPERAAQQYGQALQMIKSGRKTDAELELKQLSAAYPQFAGPQLNLGLLYLGDSRLSEAETAFKSALDINPANPVAGDELGIVERKLGKFTAAEAAYQRAIAAEPNFAPAHLNLGVLYDLYLAEPQKALEQFERYLEIAGDNKQVAGWVVELKKRVGAPGAKKEPA